MSIIKLLKKKLNRITFTTPSHNQKNIFSKNFSDFYKKDYSEIEGFDNLSNPKNAILHTQTKISDIIGSKKTFLITQGATCAMLAAMKTLINPADRILVARNCHKSVYNGLILTAGIVDWFLPEYDEKWDIYTHIDTNKLKKTLEINNYKVFIMTSPTYEGINSDIKEIAKICKQNNTYLIVDEAHGSLNGFSTKLPQNAINNDADVSINSLHKTAGALNQTALLNINKNIRNIDIELFQKSINLFHTTSPSYPLLCNIEECILYLNSKKAQNQINSMIDYIEKIKSELKQYGVEFYNNENHDPTKTLLKKIGYTGFELSNLLFDEFNIEDELCNQTGCLFLTGIGTTKQKINKLKNALKKVAPKKTFSIQENIMQPHPIIKMQPVDAYNQNFKYINKNKALHKISNNAIIPYPPGFGVLYPGEMIQEWHLKYLNNNVEIIE